MIDALPVLWPTPAVLNKIGVFQQCRGQWQGIALECPPLAYLRGTSKVLPEDITFTAMYGTLHINTRIRVLKTLLPK
jgi:hypothetical protein